MDKAKEALFSVYSWPEQIFVVSGKANKRERLFHICAALPSNNLPQPKAIKLSPEKGYSEPEYIVLYDLKYDLKHQKSFQFVLEKKIRPLLEHIYLALAIDEYRPVLLWLEHCVCLKFHLAH